LERREEEEVRRAYLQFLLKGEEKTLCIFLKDRKEEKTLGKTAKRKEARRSQER
jgi:hypothetical protein